MKLHNYRLNFLPVWLLQVLTAHVAAAPNIATDQAALVALKSQITNNILTHNWSTSVPVCSWVGITCGSHHNRVTALDLSHFGLEGSLSFRIGDLTFLAYLSLRNNSLHGPLPEELSKLRRLKVLDLGLNAFNGSIPLSLRSLHKLEDLSVESNSFTGHLPTSLLNLSSLQRVNVSHNWLSGLMTPLINISDFQSPLQVIDLSFNNLSDAISDDFFKLVPRLQGIHLSWNELYGEIPSSLFMCKGLQVVSLRNNKLAGNVRAEIGNLTSLKYLYLDHNNFSGEIPEELGQLTKMETLSLSNNRFTGSIPRSIGNCTLLKEINVADNSITGKIPVEIGDQLPYLKSSKMDRNNLSGNLPSGVFNISTLQILTVDSNNVSGRLPWTAGLFLPNLEELVLSRNKMHGTIPGSISNASKLTSIDFSDNWFVGSIPRALCDLDSLHRLDLGNNLLSIDHSIAESSLFSSLVNCRRLNKLVLSGNALNTQLPVFTGNISTSLEQFWADNCNIRGRIPAEFGNLTNLIAFHLENNELVSELPDTLGRMRRLQGQYLQGNYFEGTIKPNVCLLDSLFELSLGDNKLSGSIPECLGNLTGLRHLNLSSNNINSIIPMTMWSLKDILSINISSNFLTGSLPPEIRHLLAVVEIDLSGNNISGEIPKELQFLQSLAYLSLAKNTLQGHIPESLNHSVSMEFLDLSFNKLSGTLPKSLEALSHLKYFNVSFNELEGEIPEGGPFIDFSVLSFLKNKALCGAKRLRLPPCKTGGTRSDLHRRRALIPMIMIPVIIFVTAALYLCKMRYLARVPTKERLSELARANRTMWMFPGAFTPRSYTYREVKLATNGFDKSRIVGTGSFASVYRGVLKGREVAIKVFNSGEVRSLLSFHVEFNLMQNPLAPRPHHRNIVRIFGCAEGDGFLALIMEYMQNGSLDQWLHGTPGYHLSMVHRIFIMIKIASAIKYLHHEYARPIIHCDIKPSNILLDGDMVAHLSDFSIAQLANPNFENTMAESTIFGTIGYVAPECGSQGIVSTKSDVYSFGIMLMEVFTGKRPTDDMFGGEMSLRNWVINSLPHNIKTIMDPHLLRTEGQHLSEAKINCFLSIIRLAYCCSSELPHQRLDMYQVDVKLRDCLVELIGVIDS